MLLLALNMVSNTSDSLWVGLVPVLWHFVKIGGVNVEAVFKINRPN